MSTKSLYVGNLSYSATEEELRDLFEQWGPVADVRIIEGRGFAFVELPAANAQSAIEGTNGQTLGGRQLTVNEARPRSDRGSGGGRRSGGGGSRRGGGGWSDRW